ncbi:MAG TPA: phosphatidylglycerol lysyltransferase domain-containing protein [Gaiellaceae bacterium]|nr:phosphatidylglycerol lysyltransferase domain-containing protein [Gaiellaceae bacterium]
MAVEPAQMLEELGRNPFSGFVRYDAPWQWLVRDGGAAAYLEHGRVALVWADPLAGEPGPFLEELTRELRARRRRICLLLIGEELARLARARGYAVLKIGEQPFFDLTAWRPPRGDPGKHLRWCLNAARRASVDVREYVPADEPAVRAALAAWQDGLGRAPADSFLRASPLALVEEKRLFLAWRDGRVDALVACSTVPAAGGWLLEDLIRRPDAANGATEAAVVHALETLAAGGAACAWLDIAPLRGSESQIDPRARLLFRALRPVVSFFDARYRFGALTTYLGKFQPTAWEPRYVALKPVLPAPSLVRALRNLL